MSFWTILTFLVNVLKIIKPKNLILFNLINYIIFLTTPISFLVHKIRDHWLKGLMHKTFPISTFYYFQMNFMVSWWKINSPQTLKAPLWLDASRVWIQVGFVKRKNISGKLLEESPNPSGNCRSKRRWK